MITEGVRKKERKKKKIGRNKMVRETFQKLFSEILKYTRDLHLPYSEQNALREILYTSL